MLLYLILMIVIQLAIAYLWLRLILRLDKFKEKKKTKDAIALLYLFGTFSALLSIALYRVIPPDVSPAGVYILDDFVANMAIVGPVEEISKFLVFLLITRKLDSVREPVDGLLQGAAVGLAFASVENVLYAWWYGVETIPVRAVLSTSGHMSYTALTGLLYAILLMNGPRKAKHNWHFLLATVPACFLHGLFNYLLNFGTRYGIALDVLVLAAMAVMYRFSLRFSPYREFRPSDYRNAVPALKLAVRAHPRDSKLRYRLMLYAIYTGDYELAAESAAACMEKHKGNSIIHSWYAIIEILAGNTSMGYEGLDAAARRMTDRQTAIILGSVQQVVRSPSMRTSLSAVLINRHSE